MRNQKLVGFLVVCFGFDSTLFELFEGLLDGFEEGAGGGVNGLAGISFNSSHDLILITGTGGISTSLRNRAL